MARIPIWVLLISIFLLLRTSNSEKKDVKQALVQFMARLSAGCAQYNPNWGWNMTSDPCKDKWVGVRCNSSSNTIRKIVLDGFNFTGTLDANSVCMAKSLNVLSLISNNIVGTVSEEIRNCRKLTHLFINGNHFSSNLPSSLLQLRNLKRLDISNNYISGQLPDMSKLYSLQAFLAQGNHLTGAIPEFNFTNLLQFNVSNNNFTGPIPDVQSRFSADSFSGNPGLCGKPLPTACTQVAPTPKSEPLQQSSDGFLLNPTLRFLVHALFFLWFYLF